MTELERIDNSEFLIVGNISEPSDNKLLIRLMIGLVLENAETVSVSGIDAGSDQKVSFDTRDNFDILFRDYISYFVINESYNRGMEGKYVGKRIREYASSNFIDFCKQQNIFFNLWDDSAIRHYSIIAEHHVIHVLTTSEPIINEMQ